MSQDLPKLVVGTHHKAGTVLMRNIVRDIGAEFDVPVWVHDEDPQPDDWHIYLDFWSRWQVDLDSLDFGGIHMVRRPEALVYSAMLYHLRGSEEWLHLKHYDGKSYVESLVDRNLEDQLIFEMNQSSNKGLTRMVEVAADDRFYHLKLEDVSSQRSMTSLADAFLSAGVSPEICGRILQVAEPHCLWHIRGEGKTLQHSTTGMGEKWREAFTPRVRAEFDRLFGGLSADLGYVD